MDLNLVTGKPGASKTLNTIKDVEQRRKDEGRPVFYYGINDLVLPWTKMDDSEVLQDDPTAITPHSWWQAPPGSIIVIDEAQDHFPAVSINSKQPDYIKKFGQFRHLGFSMYLITQGPLLINPSFKAWVQPHIHYKRLWGGLMVIKFVNESMITDVTSSKISETAIKKYIRIDKSIFNLYKSAEMHTNNRRTNKKLWMFLILPMFLVPFLFYQSFKIFRNQLGGDEPVDEVVPVAEVASVADTQSIGAALMTTGQYFDPTVAYVPRIEAMPETAPAYDDLRKPVDFPRPQCVLNVKKNICSCYTQQATLLKDYPAELCASFVADGYFDATKPRAQSANFENQRQENNNSG